jgi:hypothetical protein
MNDYRLEALQDMYLFDPMTGKPLPKANPTLLKIALRKNRCDDRLEAINKLPLIVIDNEPTWENGINVSGPDITQDNAFPILAAKLEYNDKWPLELSTMTKDGITAYWIRTGV